MLNILLLATAMFMGSGRANVPFAQSGTSQRSNAAEETTLTVSIEGLRNTKGQVMVQLWNRQNGFPTKGENGYKATVIEASKAVNKVVTTTFRVPPGTYAVSVLHDENSNGKMDFNAFGIPKEGYGASNNPVNHFHAPTFDQARFQVPPSGQKISLSLRY